MRMNRKSPKQLKVLWHTHFSFLWKLAEDENWDVISEFNSRKTVR